MDNNKKYGIFIIGAIGMFEFCKDTHHFLKKIFDENFFGYEVYLDVANIVLLRNSSVWRTFFKMKSGTHVQIDKDIDQTEVDNNVVSILKEKWGDIVLKHYVDQKVICDNKFIMTDTLILSPEYVKQQLMDVYGDSVKFLNIDEKNSDPNIHNNEPIYIQRIDTLMGKASQKFSRYIILRPDLYIYDSTKFKNIFQNIIFESKNVFWAGGDPLVSWGQVRLDYFTGCDLDFLEKIKIHKKQNSSFEKLITDFILKESVGEIIDHNICNKLVYFKQLQHFLKKDSTENQE
jgi:hypothetical protein